MNQFVTTRPGPLWTYANNYKFKDGEKLNIVAHSWGGEVAKLYTFWGQRKIDTLVTLGTPERFDILIDMHRVGNYFNVYSSHDIVQTMGGMAACGPFNSYRRLSVAIPVPGGRTAVQPTSESTTFLELAMSDIQTCTRRRCGMPWRLGSEEQATA